MGGNLLFLHLFLLDRVRNSLTMLFHRPARILHLGVVMRAAREGMEDAMVVMKGWIVRCVLNHGGGGSKFGG